MTAASAQVDWRPLTRRGALRAHWHWQRPAAGRKDGAVRRSKQAGNCGCSEVPVPASANGTCTCANGTQAASASGTCTWHLAASLAGQLHYLPLLGVATTSGMGMRPGPGVEAGLWPLSRSRCVPTRTEIIDGMIWIEEPEPGPGRAGFPASRRFLTLRHSSRNRDPNKSLST